MLSKIKKLFGFSNDEVSSHELLTAKNLFDDSDILEIDKGSETNLNFCGMNSTEKTVDVNVNSKQFKELFVEQPNFDKNKNSILIIDDNPGIISFMKDDIENLDKYGVNIDDYNIITFTTKMAAYQFEVTQRYYGGLNIQYAIIDLTLGGTLFSNKGNVKYTGIDVLQQIMVYNPEVKYLFYTGNSLNKAVNTTEYMLNQFKKLTGNNIYKYILFKTSLDSNDRKEFIANWLKE